MTRVNDAAAVLPLGWALCAPTSDQIDYLRGVPAHRAFATLRLHKVLLQARRHLAGTDLPLAALLRTETRSQRQQQVTLPDTWRVVAEMGTRAGYRPALMKGAAARSWYPDPAVRHLGDLDVWVPDQADAWHLCRNLMRFGWRLNRNELPWVKSTGTGDEYGVVNLVSTARLDRHDIDIHFGHYSVRHCAWIPLRLDRIVVDGDQPPRLADEENLAVILANAAGDQAIGLKDVNDTLLAAGRPGLDWARVRSLLDAAGLREFAVAVGQAAQRFYLASPDLPVAVPVVRHEFGTARHRPERASDGFAPAWLRRAAVVRHAWRVGRRAGLGTAARSAGSAAMYYSLPLRPRLVRWAGGPGAGTGLAGHPRRCVRLVPLPHLAQLAGVECPPAGLDTTAHRALGWHATRGMTYVDSAGAVFVPTVYGRLSRRRVRVLAAELAT